MFRLMEQCIGYINHHLDTNQKRTIQLERSGAYRAEGTVSQLEWSFKPRFSGNVHQVDRVPGWEVVGEEGGSHPFKFARPALASSVPAVPRDRFVRRGSAHVENRRQVISRKFPGEVAAEIRKAGGTLEVWKAGTFLQQVGGFEITSQEEV
ncbi:hypothetical protein N9L68_01075 [bacterium]|nr:hypothetical protein [bacterium]